MGAKLTPVSQKRHKEKKMSIAVKTKTKCAECGRVFDLMNRADAEEFYYGHECEE